MKYPGEVTWKYCRVTNTCDITHVCDRPSPDRVNTSNSKGIKFANPVQGRGGKNIWKRTG